MSRGFRKYIQIPLAYRMVLWARKTINRAFVLSPKAAPLLRPPKPSAHRIKSGYPVVPAVDNRVVRFYAAHSRTYVIQGGTFPDAIQLLRARSLPLRRPLRQRMLHPWPSKAERASRSARFGECCRAVNICTTYMHNKENP